ncbi:UNVERIFIED_CONTAM: hypothetical protein Sangu_3168700 [Sesamum angustifolium]|uniref:Uncharacterized protein n=1 Tax=Sesamum angustifolium TaxID=2727405 RepID=A0AAW2JW94_9LAMI
MSTHWDDAVQMDWAQMMIFYAVGLGLWSNYNENGASNDGMRSCPTDAEPSSYYGGGPYDYVSGLADRFHDVVHASKQPLWNGCTQSQLTTVAELILPHGHTLPLDYYNTKKLIRDLSLPVEKIDACKNGCMLYWNDNIDLVPVAYPSPGEVYALEATAEQMTWHANHQTEEGSMHHQSDVEAWRYFDRAYPNFAAEPRNVRLDLCTNGFVPQGQYWHMYSC